VIEFNSQIQKSLLHNRVKLGWTLWKVDVYLLAKCASDAVDTIIHIKNAKGKKYARVHKKAQI
jgi:hypothetical protein